MKLNDHDFMKGTSYREYQEEVAQLEWEAEQERKSENMMLGIYEEGISVDEYQRYVQRW
jgi:uncharacterized protein (DUF1697 family)